MNSNTVWKLPIPSTAIFGSDPNLEILPGREVAIRFEYEAEDEDEDEIRAVALIFEGVESFRFTYMTACDDSVLEAYDKLVDCGPTSWRDAVRGAFARKGGAANKLKHLMIYFDDGPCYEAICESFRVNESSRAR